MAAVAIADTVAALWAARHELAEHCANRPVGLDPIEWWDDSLSASSGSRESSRPSLAKRLRVLILFEERKQKPVPESPEPRKTWPQPPGRDRPWPQTSAKQSCRRRSCPRGLMREGEHDAHSLLVATAEGRVR